MKQQGHNQGDVFEMILSSVTPQDHAHVSARRSDQRSDDWHHDHQEGQLAVDVLDTKEDIIVISTIAGAMTDRIEVYVHNDLLTIRGERVIPPVVSDGTYLHQECFWGKFSRTVVLPVDVKGEFSSAEYKNGVLTVRIPKKELNTKIPVTVVDE